MSDRPDPADLTIWGRLRSTPGVAIYFALAAAALVLAVVCVTHVGRFVAAPDVGFDETPRLTIQTADARWRGVANEDALVAFDGVPLRDGAQLRELVLAKQPGPLTIRFRRGDREWDVTAAATPRTAANVVGLWISVATGIALWTIGLLAFLVRPRAQGSWPFVLFCAAVGGLALSRWMLSAETSNMGRLHFVFMTSGASFGLHLFSTFPSELPIVRTPRARFLAFYAPSIALLAATLPFYPRDDVRAVWWPAYQGVMLWIAIAALTCVVIVISQYRAARRGGEARLLSRYLAILVGTVLGVAIPTLLLAVWLSTSLFDQVAEMRSFVVLPFLIFVGMTGYAMVKHNAWEVDRFTASVLGYAATTSALGAAFAVMLVVSPLVLQDAGSPYWLALRTGIVCAAFFPAYRAIKRRIDRAFFRTSRDAATVTETLRDLKQALHDAGPARGKEMIVEAAMTLDADRAQLWLADEAGARLVLASTRGDIDVRSALALDGELVRSLEGVRAGGIEGLAPDALPEAAQVALWERRLAMAAPIRAHGALGGFLGVGRKRSGTAYRVDELLFLAALAAEAGGLEQRERITSLFKRYLNPHVVDALLADPDQVSVRGERRRLSVLFVDLVDFTARAESSTPEDVLVFLNRYFDEAGATLAARGATLDKFVGDAIMCFWNAPLPQRDHEARACLAALDLVAVVARLDAELVAAGQRGVRCRVGVGTGECVVGTVGARDAQSYTAIGDPVNVASRLENLCTYYGTQTLITEDTVSGLSGAIVTREVDRLIVKGRRQPLRAFELLGPAGTVVGPSIAAYAHGLELYRAGDFTAAREVFRDHPDDGPSRLLAQRCEVFLAAPPPPDWEGTFAFDRK